MSGMECIIRLNHGLGDKLKLSWASNSHSKIEGAKNVQAVSYLLKCTLTDLDLMQHRKDIICVSNHLDVSVFIKGVSEVINDTSEESRLLALADLLKTVMSENSFFNRLLTEQATFQHSRFISQLMVNVPSLFANKLQFKLPDFFSSSAYSTMLATACCAYLDKVAEDLRDNRDSSIGVCSCLIGKLGVHFPKSFDVLVPFLLRRSVDFIFRRVVQRTVASLPSDVQENTIVLLCYMTPCFAQMDWLFEDSVVRDSGVQHVLIKKLLLGRHFSNDRVVRNVVGYLCSSPLRREIACMATVDLFNAWSDKVLMKYQTVEQQGYLSAALLCVAAFIKTGHLVLDEPVRTKCIQACLHGVHNHLNQPDDAVRHYGMIVGQEFLSAVRSDVKSPDFPIDRNRFKDLYDLMRTPHETLPLSFSKTSADSSQHSLNVNSVAVTSTKDRTAKLVDSDDDSGSDSNENDIVYQIDPQCKTPVFLRDCLRLMVPDSNSGNADNIEQAFICLERLPDLIVKYPEELRDIAVDLCQLVLFCEECPKVFPRMRSLKRESLIRLLIYAPKQASAYLIDKFYSVHLNHTQRLDILAAISLASDRYVKEISTNTKQLGLSSTKATEIAAGSNNFKPPSFDNTNDPIQCAQSRNSGRIVEVVTSSAGGNLKNGNDLLHNIDCVVDASQVGRRVIEWTQDAGDDGDEVIAAAHGTEACPLIKQAPSHDEDQALPWAEVVAERVRRKTRRFASSPRVAEVYENRFGEVAGYFFYPLLRPFTGGGNSGIRTSAGSDSGISNSVYGSRILTAADSAQPPPLWMYDDDSLLLVRLLQTLAIVMSCARNTPAARSMTRTLLQFAAVFRFDVGRHAEQVRAAAAFAVAAAATAIAKDLNAVDQSLSLLDELVSGAGIDEETARQMIAEVASHWRQDHQLSSALWLSGEALAGFPDPAVCFRDVTEASTDFACGAGKNDSLLSRVVAAASVQTSAYLP